MGAVLIAWYIHGAGASERSFVWLHQQIDSAARFFEYAVKESVTTVAQRLIEQIEHDARPAMLIGHSLGGIVAARCADASNVERIVTLCSPFGGVSYASFLSLFSTHPLFADLCSHGPLLTHIRNQRVRKPHLAIVGSRGLPFQRETNDGVISMASQTALDGPRYEAVPFNHFEVLLSHEVAELIRDFAIETT